jgi:diguanylate cyclase (GGDEF)-like protein
MFIKEYVRLLLKRWWLIALAFSVVFIATYVWTFRQTPVYEASASFVIRPSADTVPSNDFIKALDTMSNRSEINLTFAEVASSDLIQNKAMERLGLSPAERKGLTASGNIVGGTNILNITVQSHDPEVARAFTDAVGAETVEYVRSLYDVFQLEVLDAASVRSRPVKPDVGLNLTLGAFLGLALGGALVFLLESLKPTFKEVDTFNIIDRETGAYNKSYLSHRLFQEMARARRVKSPLSFGLVKVHFNGDGLSQTEQVEALRTVKLLTEKVIREEDILARFNGTTFAIVFPDMQADNAHQTVEAVRQAIGSVAHDMDTSDGHSHIGSYASVISFNGGKSITQDRLMEQAVKALEQSSPA